MARAFSEIAFTRTVRDRQSDLGSRDGYAALDSDDVDRGDQLGPSEIGFIQARDGFYQATVSETGWPYVQFRGGPAGFLKVLDQTTLAYADFRGNRQYISHGNLETNEKVSLILMDYPSRTRLKIWALAQQLALKGNEALAEAVSLPGYRALPERIVKLSVKAFDWNCPQHIPQRFSLAELAPDLNRLQKRIQDLEEENAELKAFLGSDSRS
ncbi:pyridoxamine 5'-phosphate oxidase family protein [uncultured Roseibium sp.]|uniref:pyridoxamine 5'-phosphate oxidase family protein n=1 Tax=uncultured Roseibium sp. TaxID=1936171 RepID=UPI00262EAB14|nr:pyridoxamine 5'-phosphate oxidase family protein [uncultured Roseibium sp.]